MPVWEVREANVDYRLFDTPLKYTPAYGPAISLDLVYQTWRPTDFDYYPRNDSNPLFGPQWHCAWSSELYIYLDSEESDKVSWNYLGGRVIYSFDDDPLVSDPNYQDGSRVEIVMDGSDVIGGRVTRSDGRVLEYFKVYSFAQFLLTSMIDPDGKALTFSYDDDGRLSQIVTATGETNSFVYGDLDGDMDLSNDRVVTQINAPGGYVATFSYEYRDDGFSFSYSNRWYLTNITDTVGISSTFTYGTFDGFFSTTYFPLETLNTPYGTTRFQYLDAPTNQYGFALLITEPNGGQHLYVQEDTYDEEASTPPVPATFDSAVIPTGLPLGTLDTSRPDRNTFYWGPLQLAGIGNLEVQNWTWTEFKRARIRHWLGYYDTWDIGHLHISDTLAWEQSPSPDGSAEGQVTWYDYASKDTNRLDLIGTNTVMPAVTARVLPNGSTWYQYSEHNSLGKPTRQVETYSKPDSTIGTRTNTFVYAANGIDLVKYTGPDGTQVSSNQFNASHQVVTNFNALNEVTVYKYNANQQLTRVITPAGLTITNIYNGDDFLEKTIDIEIARTNSFTYYTNGLVNTHTDERGLITTNTWDALQRLSGASDRDGTLSNRYTHLDLTATKDRLGKWTYFTYNQVRQMTAITNALTNVTVYAYCTCGALNSVTDPLGNITSFYYDNLGRTTNIVYPGGSSVMNQYNLIGQMTNTTDSAGVSVTNWYNHQGLMVSSSNAFGRISSAFYDIEDRATNTVDANGISITSTFDALGRVKTRTYPDGGVEKFGYSVKGLSAYTNQLSKVTKYGYDQAQRKTAETNANNEVTQFRYDASGNLTNLIDGRTNNTFWKYDVYGRVTNKVDHLGTNSFFYSYDANGRLTNRVSAAKGRTSYGYDAVGNLTSIDYTNSTDITLSYDANNRLTNMVDAAGTNRYSYTAFGALASEDGPWDSDTVSYSYSNQLRSSLSLQQPNASPWTQSYGYDAAKRLTSLTSPAGAFTYSYDGTRKLQIGKLTLPNTAFITNTYDSMAQVTGTYLKNSGGTDLNLHAYQYNVGHQRTQQTRTDETTAGYLYDNINQLINITTYGFGSEPGVTFYQNPGISTAPWWVKLTRTGDVFTAYQSLNGSSWTLIGSATIEMTNSVYVGLAVTAHDDGVLNLSTFDNVTFLSGWTNADVGSPGEPGSAWFASGTYSIYGGGWDIYDTTDAFHYVYVPLSGNGEFVARVVSVEETDDWAKAGIMIRDGLGASARNAMVELSPGVGVSFQWRSGVSLRVPEHLIYTYDKAGNLTKRQKNQFTQNFTINQLNQLTNGTRSGTLAVAGTTSSPATNVTVNGLTASRFDDNTFFRAGFTVTNGNNVFTAIAKDSYGRVDTNTVTTYLPATNIYSYDLNGNLLTNGTQMLEYDDENQLIRVTMTNTWKSEFTYDGKMRRRIRKEYLWQNSAWVQTNEVRYIYDGNLVLQERDANNLPTVSYSRGRDLSGSLEGAGGIGGLLARTDNGLLAIGDSRASAFYHADGNGNITALINTNQIIVAKYLFDPFGNMLSISGPLAEANLYRFSSKEAHPSSGLVYYLYRYYDPNLQRWPNRDPIGERGNVNLYGLAGNAPIDVLDFWGLQRGQRGGGGPYSPPYGGGRGHFRPRGPATEPGGEGPIDHESEEDPEGYRFGDPMWFADRTSSALTNFLRWCLIPSPPTPPKPPPPIAPPDTGCSICPVNGPPIIIVW